ncbi:helix-turn-helix transcriptional regulator [Oceanospirillum beijerinckii]|uniref:helix-turn-helix transcriptional regulator n=1 Tax=Oceanospirillum beijerinckii TaxID=64976 RepID=UPI00056A81BF|nr:helix-turn-helix transcriptional regulator [Oceanospirillum beijerinckii]
MNKPKNNILMVRKRLKLGQGELGQAFDPPLTQVAVSYHERGKRVPDVYQALRYSQVLGCSVEELFPILPLETGQ